MSGWQPSWVITTQTLNQTEVTGRDGELAKQSPFWERKGGHCFSLPWLFQWFEKDAAAGSQGYIWRSFPHVFLCPSPPQWRPGESVHSFVLIPTNSVMSNFCILFLRISCMSITSMYSLLPSPTSNSSLVPPTSQIYGIFFNYYCNMYYLGA